MMLEHMDNNQTNYLIMDNMLYLQDMSIFHLIKTKSYNFIFYF